MTEPLRVLILEDNAADAELVQFELQEAGIVFISRVVMTEEDFIHEIQEFCPDLILSDYDLPRYNGALALAEARKKCPETPFILVTGAVTEDRAIDILTQGAKDFVMKQRLNKLVPAIQRALAEAEEHRARKQAEKELRKAHKDLESLVEQRTSELQTVLDTAPVAIWIAHDPECRLITGNAYADEIIMNTPRLGNISRSAALGEAAVSYRVFHDGVELKPEEMPAQVATATGKPVTDMDVELVFSDGRHVHLIESAMPLFDSNGHVRGAVITGSDVSQIKQSEIAFKQSEERIQQALRVSHSFTFEWELATDRVRRSESCATMLGLTGDEAVQDTGQNYFQRVHPDDRARFVAMLDRLTPANASYTAEYRVVRGDGHVVVFEETGAATFDAAGKLTRLAGVTADITDRKQLEDGLRRAKAGLEERVKERTAELQASSVYARSLIDASVDPLVTISADGAIMDANRASEEMTGVNRQELIGSDFSTYFTEPEKARAGYLTVFRDGSVKDYPLELRHRDGHTTPILYNASVYRDETGKIAGVFAAARDISRLKRAEEALRKAYGELEERVEERTLELTKRTAQLEEANKELESFSYSVSHDLRAPLRAIDGFSRMILKQQRDNFDENTRHRFDQIIESTRMMELLIEDLLALSRLGREALSVSGLNLQDLSRDVWEELKTTRPGCPADLKINPVPPAMGDRSLIRQVLVNLFSNAVKFSRNRKTPLVEVGGHSAEGENIYYVRDNGVGFDMQYHDKLFGVFQRLHSRAEYEGTGVGLAIVYRIIQRHGGRVWAEGEVDKGATFYFTLPAAGE